jgi:hypothetical protein
MSRKLTVELDRLLDLVVAVQMDGLDTVHDFLGEMVGVLSDSELHQYVQTLGKDGYNQKEKDQADRHLRKWREQYAVATGPVMAAANAIAKIHGTPLPEAKAEDNPFQTYENEGFET